MSTITKKVTMTETAWAILKEIVDDDYNECVTFGGEEHCRIDISDALTALAEAETIAVSETYAIPQEVRDAWAADATAVGVTPDVPPVSDCLPGYSHVGSYDDPNTCYNCCKSLR